MRKTFAILITILLTVVMYGCSSNDDSDDTDAPNDTADNQEDKPTLVFGKTPWTSTVPPTEIAKSILEDMGYKVEEKEANLGVVYTGLSTADLDIFMDFWMPNQEQYIKKYSDSVEIVSTSYEDADWGIVVPEYMEDVNDIGDLKGLEDEVGNQALTIEESDPSVEDVSAAIDAYDLDLEMVNSSEGPMLAEAEKKMDNEEPVVFYGWRPHSMFNNLDIKILTHEKTPDLFPSSSIHVVANKGLEEKAPEAYNFLSNWSIPIDDVEDMITQIDEGENPKEVTQTWIDDNQDKIEEMKGK